MLIFCLKINSLGGDIEMNCGRNTADEKNQRDSDFRWGIF